MSTHTPGPWTVVAIDWADTGNARFEIKGIRRTGMADARLIAAAPELLAALHDCREALRRAGADGELRVVDAAIAKAEGRA